MNHIKWALSSIPRLPSLAVFVLIFLTSYALMIHQATHPVFWLPAGILLSFIIRYGPGIAIAGLLGETLAVAACGYTLSQSFASGLATIITLLPVIYNTKGGSDLPFDHHQISGRLAITTLITLPIATTIKWQMIPLSVAWSEWYIGVFTGLLFPGLPLLLLHPGLKFEKLARKPETIFILTLFVLSLADMLFGQLLKFTSVPLLYVGAMIVIWIAMRLGSRVGASALLIVGVTGFIGTESNFGIYADKPTGLRLYLSFISLIAFTLSILIGRQTMLIGQRFEQGRLLRLFAEHTKDIVYRARRGQNSQIEYISPSIEHLLGFSATHLMANNAILLDLVHPLDREVFNQLRRSKEKMLEVELRFVDRGGRIHWVEIRQALQKDSKGKGDRVILEGLVRDITERKQASDRILHLNGLLDSIRQINQLITRQRDRENLLQESCRILVNNRGYKLIWIGIYDATTKTIPITAKAGDSVEFVDNFLIDLVNEPTSLGPSARSWNTASTVLTLIDQSSTLPALRVRAAEFGIHSSLAIPLQYGDYKYGLINVYADATLTFDQEEITLIEEVAGDIAYGLYNIEREEEIERLAYYDPLTELANRRRLIDYLDHQMAVLRRRNRVSALLYIDLDNFKRVNDSYGHSVGDEILRETSRRLRSRLRIEDTVARLGGDEFVILLYDLADSPNEAANRAQIVAEQIQSLMYPPCIVGEHSFTMTPSIGLTLFPRFDQSSQDVLREADTAMYRAKSDGKNRYRFFHPDMQRLAEHRLFMEQEIRRAIREKEFSLYYQPQVNMDSDLIGMEALLRWIHPTLGMISPDKFIGIAEETGLISTLGRLVLTMACTQLRRWQDGTDTILLKRNENIQSFATIAVNISVRQFHDPMFVNDVKAILAETMADPKQLVFEITESMFLKNIQDTIEKMEELCAMGIHFSIDDFGTGYSSLTYLQKLPLFEIKIDQSFIRDLVNNRYSQAIVRTIMSIAEHLGMIVIAEGVETEHQRQLLTDLGCSRFQGYLTGRPAPVDQIFTTTPSSTSAEASSESF